MSAPVYQAVGAIDPSLADNVSSDDDTILVEQDDGELLIAQPKPANGGEA